MAQIPNIDALWERLAGSLQRLNDALAQSVRHVRDFDSWQDLLDALHRALESTGGDPNENLGFQLDIFDLGKEVIYPQLLELVGLGVFPVKADPGIRQTKE